MNYQAFEVEVIRGTQVESVHTVCGAVFSRTSGQNEFYGDVQRPVFPRSSLKPIQAVPLITTGAAKAFQVSSEELALACASHRAEPMHVQRVQAWLQRIGLSETDLECGTHAPGHAESQYELIRNHQQPTAIHNNCSGKHTGMLTTALHQGEPTKNYVSLNHPVQQRIVQTIENFCQTKLLDNAFGIDGCSIPAACLPLVRLAEGFCEFASPTHLRSEDSEACQKLFSAFVTHPELTAGTGQFCTDLMIETKGTVLLKGGAEGVMIAAIPQLKLGIALKTLDGSARAVDLCMSAILNRLGLLDGNSPFLNPKIHNWRHLETGYLRLRPTS